jgi:hypothetical protein
MLGLFDLLFRCNHRNFSFPLTKKYGPRVSPAASVTGTYVVCLECGREFPYDWQEMRIVKASSKRFNRVSAEATESFASK